MRRRWASPRLERAGGCALELAAVASLRIEALKVIGRHNCNRSGQKQSRVPQPFAGLAKGALLFFSLSPEPLRRARRFFVRENPPTLTRQRDRPRTLHTPSR